MISEPECRGSDWYQLGFRDALGGLRPQIEIYADQCGKFALKPEEPRYMEGWQHGYTEWRRRVENADCCGPN